MSALFGRVLWVGWVLTGPGFQACSVALEFGSAVSVSSD